MQLSTKNAITGALIIATIVLNIAMRYGSDTLYFVGDAVCYLLLALALLYNTTRYVQIIAKLLVALTVSNLLDELLTDASIINISEVVIAVAAAAWAVYSFIQLKKADG